MNPSPPPSDKTTPLPNSETTKEYKAGNYTGLARDYSLYRPDYSPSVLMGLIGLLKKPIEQVDFVDVGAGTGIWSRIVAASGGKRC